MSSWKTDKNLVIAVYCNADIRPMFAASLPPLTLEEMYKAYEDETRKAALAGG